MEAGVAIAVFVLLDEAEAVADSVALPGMSDTDVSVAFGSLTYPSWREGSDSVFTCKKFMSLFLRISSLVRGVDSLLPSLSSSKSGPSDN